jgi:hypothetical protein
MKFCWTAVMSFLLSSFKGGSKSAGLIRMGATLTLVGINFAFSTWIVCRTELFTRGIVNVVGGGGLGGGIPGDPAAGRGDGQGGGVGGAGEGNGSVRHRTNGGGHGGGEGKAGGGGGADSGETDGDLSNAPKLRLATKTSSTVKLSTSINPCSLKGYEISLVVFQVIFFGVPGVAFASLIIIAVDVAGSLTRNVAIGGGGICVFIYFIRMVCNENKVRPYTELDRRCV